MTSGHQLLVATPLVGLAVNCVGHVFMSRFARWTRRPCDRRRRPPWVPGRGRDKRGDTHPPGLFMVGQCRAVALNLVTYLGLAYGYIGYVGLNLTSLRIHILKVLLQSGGSLPKHELVALYNDSEVVATRIEAMLRGGYLVERNGRFYTGKPTIVIIAASGSASGG